MILKRFIFFKGRNKSKFSWFAIIQEIFQSNINEQEKKRQSVDNLLNTEMNPKFLCLLYTKQREMFLEKKTFLRKNREWRIEQKMKECFLTALCYGDKEGPRNVNKKAC